MLGLYVHVPFCAAICNYCNFNRGLLDVPLKARYVEALVREIARADASPEGGAHKPADTIYFGGGTPSLLEPDEITRIIEACRTAFDLSPRSEITLEANPETVDLERLTAFRLAGVNRVSFGVQSFRDDELRRLSRLHSAERAQSAILAARDAGFDNISADLMMWLPGQEVHEWLESVGAAITLAPDHLSLYLLELYPNAPLKEESARARRVQASDDQAAVMYLTALEQLDAAGYEQYRISNVARPGRRSRHNLKYWADGDWLGFGCGAHSTYGGVRWKNLPATELYVQRILAGEPTAIDVRHLSVEERLGDALFTGLRLTEGLDMEAVGARYSVDVWQRYGRELGIFVEEGLLCAEAGRLRLTRHGMLLAHEVMAVFV